MMKLDNFIGMMTGCYIVPSVFMHSDKGKYKGKKNL